MSACLPLCAALAIPAAGAEPGDPRTLHGLPLGRYVFLTYCAGCHGFDGLAFFPSAPSFAMGDRLGKSDGELLRSIRKGAGAMPSWEDKLPDAWLVEALGYVRHAAGLGGPGPVGGGGSLPDHYYIFTPLGTELILDWEVAPR